LVGDEPHLLDIFLQSKAQVEASELIDFDYLINV
jgi:hypothetical protein